MEIKPEDLFTKCEECGGTGLTKGGRELGGAISMGGGTCEACNGIGGKRTPSGDAIYHFVRQMKSKGQL